MIDYTRIEAIPEIDLLLEISKLLPSHPTIVEIGTYLGGTTVRLAAARSDAKITTIDCCGDSNNWVPPYNQYVQEYLVEQVLNEPVSRNHLITNIKRFSNINFVEGYSPHCAQDWHEEIDLYFEDGDHFNPILKENLSFWSRHVKKGGYLAAHDYCDECPDVILEIDKFIENGWRKIALDRRLIILQKI